MKQFLKTAVKGAVSFGLIFLFLQSVDWQDIVSAAATADLWMLIAAVFFFVMSNCLGAVQWRALLRMQEITLPFGQVLLLYFVGVFFNNFMVGNIGGDAVRIYDLKRLTGKGVSGFAATFLDRFIGLFTLSCFSVVAFVLTPALWTPGLITPIAVLGLGLLSILCFGFSRRLSGWVVQVCERVLPQGVAKLVRDIRESFLLYRHAYGMLGKVGIIACGVQLCRVAVYFCVGIALGQAVAFVHYMIFIPLIAIVAAVPISFGGLGVRENMGALLLGRVGVEPATALTLMFLGYLAGILASLIGGAAFVARRTAQEVEGVKT
ncbi:MAG: lysylphosphatidylglycerol synthase transmembrane domain-containing protein [Candidatus Latescibacteria bacterium]|nr:lysylphosphatidylglycerol synthase transmembrane domain-containing protein [Candidatus Latescibacterota bacterium]